jgi:D-serine deaminase-like pyridoxal phosphate-dependent protein
MIEFAGYKVAEPDSLETPAMLLFEEVVDFNIRTMCEMAGGADNLIVHVKTHKAAAIARKKVAAGVAGLKAATLRELQMALAEEVPEAVLAYPLVQRSKVERFADLVAEYSGSKVYGIVSTDEHIEVLGAVAQARQQTLNVLLDIDVGTKRTGVGLDGAEAMYQSIDSKPHLTAAGLHMYDGHEHHADLPQRAAAAQGHMDRANELVASLQRQGMSVPRLVGGNTFTFPYYARAAGYHGSPGACVYWDANYDSVAEDMPFRWAVAVLTQVVDRHPQHQTVTTDLGIKAIPADSDVSHRAHVLGLDGWQLLRQNEEHGVFHCPGTLPNVGDYILAVPGHVCPTAMLYPGCFVVDGAGDVVDFYPHTARDRQ